MNLEAFKKSGGEGVALFHIISISISIHILDFGYIRVFKYLIICYLFMVYFFLGKLLKIFSRIVHFILQF